MRCSIAHLGQTGDIGDLYRNFGIKADTIVLQISGLTLSRRR